MGAALQAIKNGYSNISRIEMQKLSIKNTDDLWEILTNEHLNSLNILWVLQKDSTGDIIGGNQGVITPTQILAGSSTPSRFFPTLEYSLNPITYLDLKPFKGPIFNGSTAGDNGNQVIDNASEFAILNYGDPNSVLTDAAYIKSKVSDLTNLMNNQNSLNLNPWPQIEAQLISANNIWATSLITISNAVITGLPTDDTVLVLQLALNRSNLMSAINSLLIPEITDTGNILYNWISLRIHRVEGTLANLSLLGIALQASLDSIELNEFKIG